MTDEDHCHRGFWPIPKPDPLPDIIADILSMEGMHPETRQLITMAIEAQRTGVMPCLNAIQPATTEPTP